MPAGSAPTLDAQVAVVGAQVGYRDLAGFGRRFVDMDPHDLTNDVLYQLGALEAFARVAGTQIRYVEPHGADGKATTDDAGTRTR